MNPNLAEIVTIKEQKNGRIRLAFEPENHENIFVVLRNAGFGRAKTESKFILFRRKEGRLIPSSLIQMKDFFREFLQTVEWTDTLDKISRNDLLELYYQKRPIKQSDLFRQILGDVLSAREIHEYHMRTSFSYKHRYQIQELLAKLTEWGFHNTLDVGSRIMTGAPMYYKSIGAQEYLIFTHYNHQRKDNKDGFDCWRAQFANESHIGKRRPLKDPDTVRLSFNLEDDYELIEQYLR